MTREEAIHCMKVNCEESVCEECNIYGTVGTDHCYKDACRVALKSLEAWDEVLVELKHNYEVAEKWNEIDKAIGILESIRCIEEAMKMSDMGFNPYQE